MEKVIQELGLDKSKPVSTPYVMEPAESGGSASKGSRGHEDSILERCPETRAEVRVARLSSVGNHVCRLGLGRLQENVPKHVGRSCDPRIPHHHVLELDASRRGDVFGRG